ncbi:MAG: pilus assembly protein [Thermoanaerobaculia bacterium]
MPKGSLLPQIAQWLAPAIRGLLAMAPPPPPQDPNAVPCQGVPALYLGNLKCAPCTPAQDRLCAFVDDGNNLLDGPGPGTEWQDRNSNGFFDPGEGGPFPALSVGFDDPQADPTPGLVLLKTVQIRYTRADQWDLAVSPDPGIYPYQTKADDIANGNPPWGSQGTDGNADGILDTVAIPDRRNQGMYAAVYDTDRSQRLQQFPNDAFGEPSCPVRGAAAPECDEYSDDCGGVALYNASAPTDLGGTTFDPYSNTYGPGDPPRQDLWPVIPFARDWVAADTANVPFMKRLLRFSSSIVGYNPLLPAGTAYQLQESAKNVIVSAPGTPLAGALLDAYEYFTLSVFPQTDDPARACRDYIIVFITDGVDECRSNPCNGGPTGFGAAGDLRDVALPDPVNRAIAAAIPGSGVRTTGIPVNVVAMGLDPTDPRLTCMNFTNDGDPSNDNGRVFGAENRDDLVDALTSILNFKRTANFFAAPSVPAFAAGTGDAAHIGAVIPSHETEDGSFAQWSIWAGSLKAYKLDPATGNIPVVTAVASTPPPTVTPGGPTVTPTVTPIPGSGRFPDETDPNAAAELDRKPLWNLARTLGYTDPVANLGAGSLAPVPPDSGLNPAANNVQFEVWRGRKMIWADGSGVPLARQDFICPVNPCAPSLVSSMGLSPLSAPDNVRAQRVVHFLRGGITSGSGSRDEVLNLPGVRPPGPVIGPGAGEQQRYSYFFQDDAPAPGEPPQVRTDGGSNPKGYPHKLGDIFHSEAVVLNTPRYFQYLSLNLEPRPGQPYGAFSLLHSKRRKVLFVGSNDGFLHAVDAGVYGRDIPNAHDVGSGREIFAYAPRAVMRDKFPKLLSFPPKPDYFVDGSFGTADVFVDPVLSGSPATPSASDRVWRSFLVGSLRQGGQHVYALDVTHPDRIDAAGDKVAPKDQAPDCLNGGGSCTANYPEVRWELTDDCDRVAAGFDSTAVCHSIPAAPKKAAMGESWSRPVMGRIRVKNSANAFEDRYVAIFGGGYDPGFRYDPTQPIVGGSIIEADETSSPFRSATRGRAIYIVDVETGKIIYKAVQGKDGANADVLFAPMPAHPSAVDWDDDGLLDAVYLGDQLGRMWRLDLRVDTPANNGLLTGSFPNEQLTYTPFLLYDSTTSATQKTQPVFYEPSIIYLGGGLRPTLGVVWGSGDRAELARPNASVNRFHMVIDSGQTATYTETDLRNITPNGGVTPQGAGPGNDSEGYYLDFGSANEKTTSAALSVEGYLTLITFTPDSTNPCTTEGSSFRYRFFFLGGAGGYNVNSPTGTFADYREDVGEGLRSQTQATDAFGNIHEILLGGDGSALEERHEGTVQTIKKNWKEPQP